jgi:hypothetical protein
MSDHIYETRQLALWAEYKDLNGFVSFDAFMERHFKVNAYIVNLLKKTGRPLAFDRSVHAMAEMMHGDDPADAYANPQGGI